MSGDEVADDTSAVVPDAPGEAGPGTEGVRLQKVLAAAGVGSRRYCEILIDRGRVKVDGRVVDEQGLRVDPETAVIHVAGERIATAEATEVSLLNKQGRPCVGDLVADLPVRLFHVGRLDADTEGLLLLTNDGELSNRLTHPSHGVDKTYVAKVAGPVKPATLARLRAGVELDGRPVEMDSIRIVESTKAQTMIELVIHEGRNHVVRRVLAEVGHPVQRLMRTRFGPMHVGTLPPPAASPRLRCTRCWRSLRRVARCSNTEARLANSSAMRRKLYTAAGM